MSKRKPLDKEEARARRDRLLHAAGEAELRLTDAVREMRSIAGMTQEEFARHRGVSARVIKAIELGQGNPTVATLNRIGELFGLEVSFVPKRRSLPANEPEGANFSSSNDVAIGAITRHIKEIEEFRKSMDQKLATLTDQMQRFNTNMDALGVKTPLQQPLPAPGAVRSRKKSAS